MLDNFEHVIAAAPDLAPLLSACPRLRVLVTSRERLRISGEHAYSVTPLDGSDAVQLFVERARAARADLVLTPADANTVDAICARVDRLPLAIELAASRVRVFEPAALLTRLERRLRVHTNLGWWRLKSGDLEGMRIDIRRGIEADERTGRPIVAFAGSCWRRHASTWVRGTRGVRTREPPANRMTLAHPGVVGCWHGWRAITSKRYSFFRRLSWVRGAEETWDTSLATLAPRRTSPSSWSAMLRPMRLPGRPSRSSGRR